MNNIGDITTASKIGYKGRGKYIYVACPDCGTERWRPLHQSITRCWKCSANHRERQRKPLTYFGVGEPNIGDTARASTLGLAGRAINVYAKCPECGNCRWARTRYENTPCPDCTAKIYNSRRGEEHSKWKGGVKKGKGYTYVLLSPDDRFAVMGNKRYKGSLIIAEHRLVMARNIGRPLTRYEVVHHINGIKSDNRIENLQLLNEHEHHSSLVTQDLQKRLTDVEARLTLVESENVLLRFALQEVRDSIPEEQIQKLQCYNTLGNLLSEQVEGIVRSSSNRGLEPNG